MDDIAIVNLFFDRSEQAISATAEKYGKLMHSVSYRILQNNEDAEECVNEAYLGLWNTIPPQRPDPLSTYACRVTRNVSMTRYRYNKAQKRDPAQTVSLEEIGDCLPSSCTLDAEMDAREITRVLEAFLDGLSPEALYVFMRRYWYMEPVDEIAKSMRISSAAVYLRLDRLKKRLFKHLKKNGVVL